MIRNPAVQRALSDLNQAIVNCGWAAKEYENLKNDSPRNVGAALTQLNNKRKLKEAAYMRYESVILLSAGYSTEDPLVEEGIFTEKPL